MLDNVELLDTHACQLVPSGLWSTVTIGTLYVARSAVCFRGGVTHQKVGLVFCFFL